MGLAQARTLRGYDAVLADVVVRGQRRDNRSAVLLAITVARRSAP